LNICHPRPLQARLIAVLALFMAASALGQPQPDVVRRLERQLREMDATYRLAIPPDQPIAERLLLDFGGTYRFGFYAIDDPTGETRILRQSDARVYLRAELDGTHRFFGRLRFQYDDWNSGDSFDGRGDELRSPIGERYWYQFDLRGAKQAERGERVPYNLNVKAGRQFVDWGTGLTLSNDLYAGLVDVEYADLGVIGLVGLTPSGDTVDFDGSRPGFDSDTDRAFYGGVLEYRGFSSHRPYAYVLVQRDDNSRDFRTFQGALGPIPTRFDYDSTYVGLGGRGSIGPQLRYRVEVVYELGEGLSNSFDPATTIAIPQTREDIDAWAGVLGLTYLLRDEADTRIDFELIGGSGDDDRLDSANTFGGNRPGTDDNAFNALGYVNTGLALAPEPSNLLSARFGVSTYPFLGTKHLSRARVGVSGLLFAKIDEDAPLNVRTTADTFVGGEIDLYLDWRLASDVNAHVRYGLFLPGDAMPADEDDPRHFVYAGLSYAF
jgi:hypothetical protein